MESAKTAEKKENQGKSALRENIEAIIIAIVIALFIRTFIIQAFKVPTGSMLETIQLGDQLIVNKFIYGVKLPFTETNIIPGKKPKRGEIIVFKAPHTPDKDYIKRVIGIAGDVIEIRDKKLYVNNEYITNRYEKHSDSRIYSRNISPRDNFGPVTVPENSLFFMGDNRDNSLDSRFWGFVELGAIKGKALLIYWSWDKENFRVRWNRLGKILR